MVDGKQWPDSFQYSMAPFGYTVTVSKIRQNSESVVYKCNNCEFKSSFDPRDMVDEFARRLFRLHVDQSH